MEKFELDQIVRLKPWQELEPIKSNPPSVHEEMWQQCQGDFIIENINEEGYFIFKVEQYVEWTIAPWMCDLAEDAGTATETALESPSISWDDILNGTP